MALNKKIISAGLAALALLVTSAAASAAPAFATSNVNVRSGPGTGYRTIDSLRRGERVDVQYCEGSWCFVEKAGPDGWVSASYLDRGGRPGMDRPGRPDWNPGRPNWNPAPPSRPDWNRPGRPDWGHRPPPPRPSYPSRPGGSMCFNGPNGYFCMGN